MAWCVECWSNDRKTVTATRVLDAEDLCDLHYRKALGEGLPARENTPPMPSERVEAAGDQDGREIFVDRKPLKVTPGPAQAKEKSMDKVCAFESCGKSLTAANKSGYCTKHFYHSKKKPDGGESAVSRGRRPREASAPRNDEITQTQSVTAAISPERLDWIWSKMTPVEKANALFPIAT